MKQVIPKLRAFRQAMKRSAENTIVFENCTVFHKYNTPDNRYTNVLNLCVQENYILNEIVPYLKTKSTVKLYTPELAEPFYGKPMKLSYDLYGITDYWWLIMAVNGYFVSQDFTGWNRLLIPARSDIENILDRALYSNSEIGQYVEG